MEKITKVKCKECAKIFKALNKELKRNDVKYCSLSCAAKANSKKRKLHSHICKHCGISFNSKSKYSKYCSNLCKQKNYRIKEKSNNIKDKSLKDAIREYPCEICGYSTSNRDVHHIIPVSEGGKNYANNIISLCPNCHRETHSNLISQANLLEVVKNRTISSSLKNVLTSIKEQNAFSCKD